MSRRPRILGAGGSRSTKIDDPQARQIVVVLLAVGMFLVGIRLALWVGQPTLMGKRQRVD